MTTPACPDGAAVAAALSDLEALLARLPAMLAAAGTGARTAEGWTPHEELGHCIDSALNNLQRIVRLRAGPLLGFPAYDPDAWVAAGGYAQRPWAELVEEWRLLNRHLLHAARRVPAEALARPWQAPDGPQTLAFILVDYVAHLRQHLAHLLGQDLASAAGARP